MGKVMNDRIKEFAEKAEKYTSDKNPEEDSYGRPVNEKKYIYDRDAKFAELIAKEILNIADECDTFSQNPEWLICERLGINHDWRRQDNFWS